MTDTTLTIIDWALLIWRACGILMLEWRLVEWRGAAFTIWIWRLYFSFLFYSYSYSSSSSLLQKERLRLLLHFSYRFVPKFHHFQFLFKHFFILFFLLLRVLKLFTSFLLHPFPENSLNSLLLNCINISNLNHRF